MANTTPIAITIIGVALVAIASLVWRRQASEKLERIDNERETAFFAQWTTGVVSSLMAAILMFDGHILGENTTGISIVLGVAGISLIATSNVNLLSLKRKCSRSANRTQVTTQNSVIIQSAYQERGMPFGLGDGLALVTPKYLSKSIAVTPNPLTSRHLNEHIGEALFRSEPQSIWLACLCQCREVDCGTAGCETALPQSERDYSRTEMWRKSTDYYSLSVVS